MGGEGRIELPEGRRSLGAEVWDPSGYSTAVAFWKGVHSLILGAPRHQHTGKVVIFTQEARHWRPKSEVRGTQVGMEGARA